MNITTKSRFSAWLLLSVFVPMLLLSSLHVHSQSEPVEDSCTKCVNHIPHAGHFLLLTHHAGNCVLCQFVTLTFVAATVLLAVALPRSCATLFVASEGRCLSGAVPACSPRAPPVV